MATRTGTSEESTTTFGANIIPENLMNLINQAIAQMSQFQGQFPLSSLMNNLAEQIVPLTPLELQLLGQQVATSQAPAIGYSELGALTDINQLIGGPIGSSPATQAGMQAFQQLQAPEIAQAAALAGQSRGGGFLEAMQQGSTAAALPLIQQEISNRLGVLPALAGIGSTVADRERGDVATALGAAGAPRQIAQEQATANWQDVMRRAGLVQGVDTGVFSQFAPFTVTPGPQSTSGTSFSKTTTPGIWSSMAKKSLVLLLAKSLLLWHIAATWAI